MLVMVSWAILSYFILYDLLYVSEPFIIKAGCFCYSNDI